MKKLIIPLIFISLIIVACNSKRDQVEVVEEYMPNVSLTEEEIKNGILTPEILWKFGRIGDFQISPDGKTVVYNITHYDVDKNKGFTHIYTISVDGRESKRLTGGEFSYLSPSWTRDGKKIMYLSTETDTVALWVMDPDGKNRTKVSDWDKSINAYKISPKGDKIILIADVKIDKTPQEIYPDLPKANVIMTEDLMYRHWNSWTDYSYSHIFIADLDKDYKVSNPVDIIEGEPYDAPMSPYFDESEFAWSPDGKYVAYSCKKLTGIDYALSTDSDIYLYELATGITKNISKGMPGYDRFPVFSSDSKQLVWSSMETPGYESDIEKLFVFDIETGNKENLTSNFDYSVEHVIWPKINSKQDKIYFISCIKGTHQIFTLDLTTREIIQITDGYHDYQDIKLAGDRFIVKKMSMSMASELFTVDFDGTEKQLTYTNQHIYDKIEFGKVIPKLVNTTDNKKMLVWLILPPKFDATKKYPAILYCQGGPQSPVSQFFSYRWNFQLMAANGYVVIAPNRRGVPGFGSEWLKQISGDYGGQNMKDYISAVEYCKNEPFIDENRIGAVGASYGGFSVFWLAGHNENKLFKVFIAHCGMFNLESQYAATEETFFVNHDLGGPYWDETNKVAQNSYKNSPHRFVHKWNTPILIITGGYDFRIPYTESLQAFNAAKLNGIDAKLLYFPDESHFVLKPQNSILWQREFKAWLDEYLK
ncbi:MAG: S9 family peptidase [Bacteroidales bacterium]|nr:S9 family peptidase [Bacteroidales bacterium]HOL97603.1 S9 family peptidase [Bacteroidales bacterium]HOM36744.1 S9 family peptidase [Bacteroidales bacterium]HPD23294.1 S9 family peptidase [Bacteroidales bacterium]HRS99018.1 S9 family peptidase [Bacteroidales bacterium]